MTINKNSLLNISSIIAMATVTVLVILFSKGWRLNVGDRTIVSTGILDVQSAPRGAQVYLDGEEKGKSPTVLDSLAPGKYELELRLENYVSWQKEVEIKEENVTKVEAFLFEEETALEQISDIPLNNIIFSQSGNEALIVSSRNGHQGIWKIQLKSSFFTLERTKVKVANLYEPEYFDLLKYEYELLPSPDFAKALLIVKNSPKNRTFLLDLAQSQITELTEYLSESTPAWSKNSNYLLYNVNNSLISLKISGLQEVILTNWNNKIWDDSSNHVYFVLSNPTENTLTLNRSNFDGTSREELPIPGISVDKITNISSNPTHDTLLITTDSTYLYDLRKENLEKLSDFSLTLVKYSPNHRYALLKTAGEDNNIYTYDFEYPVLTKALDNFSLNPQELLWAPNDLKLFYRHTNQQGSNIITSLDPDGGNTIDILTVENYEADLSNRIGFSSDAKELYAPFLSNTIKVQEAAEEGQEDGLGDDEILLFKRNLL